MVATVAKIPYKIETNGGTFTLGRHMKKPFVFDRKIEAEDTANTVRMFKNQHARVIETSDRRWAVYVKGY